MSIEYSNDLSWMACWFMDVIIYLLKLVIQNKYKITEKQKTNHDQNLCSFSFLKEYVHIVTEFLRNTRATRLSKRPIDFVP